MEGRLLAILRCFCASGGTSRKPVSKRAPRNAHDDVHVHGTDQQATENGSVLTSHPIPCP